MHPLVTLLALLVAAGPAWAQAGGDPEPLVAEALAASPGIEAAVRRAEALSERADVAGTWPDPMVSFEYSNAPVTTWNLSDHPMAGAQLKVQQTVRPPGWSGTSREVVGERAEAANADVDEARLQLALAVRRSWWELARTRLLRGVTTAHLKRAEELLAAVRARYETGGVGQYAVMRLEVLRDRLADDLHEFDQRDAALTARLIGALSAEDGRTFATPSEIVVLPAPPPGDWRGLALDHRPLIARVQAEQRAAEAAAHLARLDGLPDPMLWAGYRARTATTPTDPGTDLVSIGVGIPIPTGSGRLAGGERAASLAQAAGAEAAAEALLDGVVADMDAILARWTRAAEKAATYEERLIPGARGTLEATQSDFVVGRADFSSLFEAEVALLDLERARIDATIDTHVQQAEATAVLGIAPPGEAP